MTSHYATTTTIHDFGSVLGWPLHTFFWALTISWSWLLARVQSGPKAQLGFISSPLGYETYICLTIGHLCDVLKFNVLVGHMHSWHATIPKTYYFGDMESTNF
jgi:hypothetical protein